MLKRFAATYCLVAASVVSAAAATGDAAINNDKGFRYYPGFRNSEAVVEVAHDKGLTVEIIIRCPVGTGIINWSKVERLYCLPDHSCKRSLKAAVRHLCR